MSKTQGNINKKELRRVHLSTLLAFACGMAMAGAVYADATTTASSADTSNWKCRLCTYAYGWTGDLDFGLGNVSTNSYKFGEYNGLEKSGLYLIGGGNAIYRNKDGKYFDVNATNLGLSSRDILLQGGQQGFYEFSAEYQEIPQFIADSGRTPFLGIGSDTLTLPSYWVSGGSTGQMSKLNSSLRNVDIQNTRRIASFGAKFIPPESHWHFSANF
ncbi:MAG: MtrB/PioB family outer membrane beta-barrel protein, partial [Gammaproteobacteria bacterium]|nr:MtrB/PioB family outer membrane beta-barrel protein [Gammaproteobacteria bacterium]